MSISRKELQPLLNPAAIQFEEDTYTMLRNAGVSESRIDAMRSDARRAARDRTEAARKPTLSHDQP